MRLRFLGLLGLLFAAATAHAGEGDAKPAAGAPPAAPSGAASERNPWDDVPVISLNDAIARGLVVASGRAPKGYRSITLRLRSRAKERIAVDIAGSHLTPRNRGSCQRLGLGPPVEASAARRRGPGSAVVELEPSADAELAVNTCCLDSNLPCPGSQEFDATSAELPVVRKNVLRWWTDHPEAPQSSVNQAIWTNSAEVHVAPGVVPAYARPNCDSVAVHRGTCYRIVGGELTATDREGVVRLLGSEVFSVCPTDDGLYAVALGDDRRPKLFLVPMTAENGWTKVADLDGTRRIRDVLPAGRGNLVLVTDRGIDWFARDRGTVVRAFESKSVDRLSVRRAGDDRFEVTDLRPERKPEYRGGKPMFEAAPVCEIWELSGATGKTELAEELWNMETILAGPAGVFALSHVQGELHRLRRGKFEGVASDREYARIVAVANDVVWLADREDRLVAADPRTGALRFRVNVVAKADFTFDTDPETGDLAYVAGGDVHWVHADDGRDVKLPRR